MKGVKPMTNEAIRWFREGALMIIAIALFVLVIATSPAQIMMNLFTTENFKNLIYILFILVVCIKEYKGQEASENFWRIIWIVTAFYFGTPNITGA